MPSPRTRRAIAAVLTLATATAAAPAAASAASVTVTGDDGNPVGVPIGAPPTIRNMKPDVGVSFPPGEGRYRLTLTGPGGAAAGSGADCFGLTSLFANRVNYAGNGAYTATVSTYASTDRTCATPLTTEAFSFTIAASTALTPPGPLTWRQAGSFTTNPLGLAVALNPGADTHEVRFAPNATLGPDGGIVGNAAKATPDPATGVAQLRFDAPGVYTAVARPTRFSSAGEIGGPWSAPVTFVVAAPFDVVGGANGLNFRDSRGPSYSVRFQLREKSTRGTVTVSIARGIRGGRYRSLGTARISRIGSVAKRFTASRSGTYRLRFSYKGSRTTLAGRQTFAIKVRRVLAFG